MGTSEAQLAFSAVVFKTKDPIAFAKGVLNLFFWLAIHNRNSVSGLAHMTENYSITSSHPFGGG